MENRASDVRFAWWKPESGFEWGTTKTGDRQLRWKSERKGGWANHYQPPLSLFRRFAAIRITRAAAEKEILKFADEYGDILAEPGSDFYKPDEGLFRIRRGYATLSTWEYQVRLVRRAVRDWEQSKRESPRESVRESVQKRGRLPSRNCLKRDIEEALRDVRTPCCTRVCLNEKLELFVYPVNLLAFMWLTLARLLSGEIVEQPCMGRSEACVGYIYTGVGPGLKKTGSVTCSVACRKWKERHRNESPGRYRAFNLLQSPMQRYWRFALMPPR